MSKTAWQRVQIARMMDRPTSKFYIDALFEDFIELHGDRGFADDGAVVGGIAMYKGTPVTVIGEEKGGDVKDRARRNFGSPHPEGYRKALRLMKQADKFGRPIINFIDTQGAYCGTGAEERGQGEAIARNLTEMMALKVPILSIVIGEGGSGGALALGVADKVAMLENSVYSILSPEGFAAILWKDSTKAEQAADVMKITAEELLSFKIIEEIIPEPQEGAQADPQSVVKSIDDFISRSLSELRGIPADKLTQGRYDRFRSL